MYYVIGFEKEELERMKTALTVCGNAFRIFYGEAEIHLLCEEYEKDLERIKNIQVEQEAESAD